MKEKNRNHEKELKEIEKAKGMLYNMLLVEKEVRENISNPITDLRWKFPEGEVRIEKSIPEEGFFFVSVLIPPQREKDQLSRGPIIYYFNLEESEVSREIYPAFGTPAGPRRKGEKALEELLRAIRSSKLLVVIDGKK